MLCFVMALDCTSVGNVVIFENTKTLFIFVGKALLVSPIVFLEGVGALMAFGGVVLCVTDASSQSGEETSGSNLGYVGDFLALLGAFCCATYLMFGKMVRLHLMAFVFTFLNMFGASIMVLLFLLMRGEKISFSQHYNHGLFGWMNVCFSIRLIDAQLVHGDSLQHCGFHGICTSHGVF